MTSGEPSIPEPLASLATKAIAAALIAASGGDTILPFVLAEKPGAPISMQVYAAETKASVAIIRAQLPKLASEFVDLAIVYDGYLTKDGVRTDCFFLNLWQPDRDLCIEAAQRYRPKKLFRRAQLAGSLEVLGYLDKPLASIPE